MTVQAEQRRVLAPVRVGTGVGWLAATGVAYAACLLLLAAGGDRPADFTPWLKIPTPNYFWWEALFIAPVIIAGGLLATASVYLLSRTAGGVGSFDDTLAQIGPAVAIGTTFTLVPDLVIGVLLNTGAMSDRVWMEGITHPSAILAMVWTYLSLYIVAFLVVFPIAVARAHRLRRLSAVAIGWAGFAVYQGFLLVFVR
jgi:hypothetical protein